MMYTVMLKYSTTTTIFNISYLIFSISYLICMGSAHSWTMEKVFEELQASESKVKLSYGFKCG